MREDEGGRERRNRTLEVLRRGLRLSKASLFPSYGLIGFLGLPRIPRVS